MIDIHSHILPGIDDGPETMEKSVELAILYELAGFKSVIATPHWISGTRWMPSPKIIFDKIDELNQILKKNNINVAIHQGMEIALDSEIINQLNKNNLLTLAGQSYILIEAPFQRMPLGWESIFFNIISKGHTVVLAHPERCSHLSTNPELADQIIEAGIYMQANYDSFLGYFGKTVKETAFHLAEKGYIHCLATDSHDVVRRHPKNVRYALDAVENRIGRENTELISRKNPQRVLTGLPLKKPVAFINKKQRKKKWLWF
jgi:protein-tyrosine phosphatase